MEKAKFFEEIQCKRKMKRLEENPKASDSAENKIDRIREDINAFKVSFTVFLWYNRLISDSYK